MTAGELIQQVQSVGGRIRVDGDRIRIQAPKGTISPELAERLRERKAEIIRRLELEASMQRLESAGINIAVWEDGSMRVLVSEADATEAIDDGGTLYSPRDMFYYLQLEPHERRMLHDFKKRFGGTTEWTEH